MKKKRKKDRDPTILAVTNIFTRFFIQIREYPSTRILAAALTIRVSKSLDPDQNGYFVGPDLGSNCLQRLSTEDKSCGKQGKRLYFMFLLSSANILQKINFIKRFFQEHCVYQIWSTLCKGYQQTTKVTASKERFCLI